MPASSPAGTRFSWADPARSSRWRSAACCRAGSASSILGSPRPAILLIGLVSLAAPFFGRQMMVWITDAGSLGVTVAYAFVAASFLALRKKEPDLPRPCSIKRWRLVGILGIVLSATMILMYVLPFVPSFLAWQEWIIVGLWALLGVGLLLVAKAKRAPAASQSCLGCARQSAPFPFAKAERAPASA